MSRIILLSLIVLSAAAGQIAPRAEASSLMSLPVHGNWCGPGHPNNPIRAMLPPVDPLDAACQRHDLCYNQRGMANCGCDINFMNELRTLRYPSRYLEVVGRGMYDALAMMPCSDPTGWAYKQSCVWRDLALDGMTGRANPMEMPMRWMYLAGRTMDYKRLLDGGW